MIRQIVILFTMALLVAGCSENLRPTASFLTGRNVEIEGESEEYVGRIGAQIDRVDFGLAATWLNKAKENRQAYGVYILQQFINDPNLPVLGNAYIGAQATLNLEEDTGFYGPIIGTSTYLGGVEILTEFQYRHYDDAIKAIQGETEDKYKIFIGPKFQF